MQTQNIEQILKQTDNYINQAIKDVQNPGPVCNMLFGSTLSRKWMLINYLLGVKFKAILVAPTKDRQKYKFVLDQQNGYQIVNKTTKVPKKYQSNLGEFKQTLFYNPVFGDNRGVAIDISNALLISELLKKAQNMRFILSVDFNIINGDNISFFISLIKEMTYLFGIENIKDYTCMVITNIERGYEYQDVQIDLKQILQEIKDPDFNKEFIKYIIQKKRITIFYTINIKGKLSTQNAKQISKSAVQIKPLLKLDLSKVKVSVLSQTRKYICENNMIFLQFAKKNLNQFLTYIDILADIQIKTIQQGARIQSELNELIQHTMLIKRNENSLREIVDRLYKIFKQKNIKIQSELMDCLYSKLILIDFVKRVILLNTIDINEFQNDLHFRIFLILKNLTLKLNQLQYQQRQNLNKQICDLKQENLKLKNAQKP